MDLMSDLLSIAFISSAFCVLISLLPLLHLFKFLFSLFSKIYRRDDIDTLAGKVVLITGASSGIGEALAYEYARRGARLALVARRVDRLRAVLDKALRLGAPDAIIIPADVSNIQHAQRFVDNTINHFGQLDHLVNNAGINQVKFFEEFSLSFSNLAPIMDINFWGSVYATRFAVPHLRKSRGKIVVISSLSGWCSLPKLSFYSASKAAMISFFESLRAEFGSDIGITIVTPGPVKSEMIDPKTWPVESAERCAKAIVKSACRGDLYLIEPCWFKIGVWLNWFFPSLLGWLSHFRMPNETVSKRNN